MTQQQIINTIIDLCNIEINNIRECPEYFHDWFDDEIVDTLSTIRKLIFKLSNKNKNKSWN